MKKSTWFTWRKNVDFLVLMRQLFSHQTLLVRIAELRVNKCEARFRFHYNFINKNDNYNMILRNKEKREKQSKYVPFSMI